MKTTMNVNRMKFLSVPLIITFILIMTSCSKEIKVAQVNNNGMVIKSTLTDREQELMIGTGAESFFVFDVNLKNKDINRVECWVDYYEKGELKNTGIDVVTNIKNIKEKTGIIMFSIQSQLVNETEEKLIISYNSKGSGCASSASVMKPKMNLASALMASEKNQIVMDKIINLAVVEKGNKATYNLEEILNNTNSSIEKISKENNTYILRCKFSHK